jgi:hypothetical protein
LCIAELLSQTDAGRERLERHRRKRRQQDGDAQESEDKRKKEDKGEAQVSWEAPPGQQAEADSIVSGGGKKRMAEQGVQELRAATGTGTTSAGAASSSIEQLERACGADAAGPEEAG